MYKFQVADLAISIDNKGYMKSPRAISKWSVNVNKM